MVDREAGGIVPVGRPYAHATAAVEAATASSPAPPGCSEVPSMTPPIICASRPRGLTARPTSTAKTALVTRGPVTPSRMGRLTVSGRQSISTRAALTDLYSAWNAMPCAVPAGIARPHAPASATFAGTARERSSRRKSRRSRYGSRPVFAASRSTISSPASFLATPSHVIDLDDDAQLAAVARQFLIPMLRPARSVSRDVTG